MSIGYAAFDEHFAEAEKLADNYKKAAAEVEAMPADTPSLRDAQFYAAGQARALLEKAQVHATLALAASTEDARAQREKAKEREKRRGDDFFRGLSESGGPQF